MVKPGIKTFGNASVQMELLIMVFIVFLILAKMAEYGIMNLNHVCAQTTKSGIQGDVSLQELTVPMEEYGIQQYMLALVRLEHFPILTNVIRFQSAGMVNTIILLTINANALIH